MKSKNNSKDISLRDFLLSFTKKKKIDYVNHIKVFKKDPKFKPFRALLLIWIIFTLSVGSTGLFTFLNINNAHSQIEFKMKTGYYQGTGKTLSISGFGFSPQMIIIKADTAAGSAIWKSISMPEGEYAYYGNATANVSENQLSLDSDGFTVQVNPDVNSLNVRYTYIAFSGNDCSSNGIMCIGSYLGDGSTDKSINNVGFQPDLVWVKRSGAAAGNFRTSAMTGLNSSYLSGVADNNTGLLIKSLDINGFTVGVSNNTNGGKFYYAAFKKALNVLDVGQYAGNGVDGRFINTVNIPSKAPSFVLVKQNGTNPAAFNIPEDYGDFSAATSLTANFSSGIKELKNNGFNVGTSFFTNGSGNGYQYFAFAENTSQSTNGSFTMQFGSYVGNGTSQIINNIGFTPDLVFIKSYSTNDYAIWSTRLNNNMSYYFGLSSAGIPNAITDMSNNSFSVGNNSVANANGVTYEYIVFGNATNPIDGNKASDFVIGAYTGNGLNRQINKLNIKPDLLVLKQTGNTISAWSSSNMPNNTTAYFSASADSVGGGIISSLDTDGFSIGNSSTVNTSGQLYNFFIFKKGSGNFDVGNFIGNGAIQDITNITPTTTQIDFQPDYVWIKHDGAQRAVHTVNDPNLGLDTLHFTNNAKFSNGITAMLPNGFTVNNTAFVNTLNQNYRFVLWKASTPTTSPDMPVGISPTNTNINLNPTLIGSNYSNPNPHLSTIWEVSTDQNFNNIVWTRTSTSSEITTIINSSNGIFLNDLSGEEKLKHDTEYFMRLKYSNGIYSDWSIPISFKTNKIDKLTNITPLDTEVINTLTPTFTTSNFNDGEIGHTASSSRLQISTSIDFSKVVYDTNIIPYTNSFTIPKAVLSDQTVYYWRAQYMDSDNKWSEYSTPTRILISKTAELSVMPLFGNTVIDKNDNVNIDTQIKSSDGLPVNNANVTINIYNPLGTKIVSDALMNYIASSKGIYRYNYTIPNSTGSYLYEISVSTSTYTGFGAANFEVRSLQQDITSVKNISTSEQIAQTNSRNEINNIKTQLKAGILDAPKTSKLGNSVTIKYRAQSGLYGINSPKLNLYDASNVQRIVNANMVEIGTTGVYTYDFLLQPNWGTGFFTILASEDTNNTSDNTQLFVGNNDIDSLANSVSTISTKIDNLQMNMDILIGAMIVTQSSVDDISPTNDSFITTLTNTTDDFYKNAVLTFTSGVLNGQSRRISSYSGSTKKIILYPFLTSVPTSGDNFTIVKQNVAVEEQLQSHDNLESNFRSDITNRLTNLQTSVDNIYSLLQTVDTNLDNITNSINNIRTSQTKNYKVKLSDVSQVQAGQVYRTKLTILDYESNPVDSPSLPAVFIYDSARNLIVNSSSMTRLSKGVYEYTINIPASAINGLWETVVDTNLGGSDNLSTNDYWQVTGAPAQVLINSMSNLTVPNIGANITITNEGGAPFEYQYEWCVVETQSNQCGGDDDIYYASAAKLIQNGDSFNTTLTANVNNPGNYIFKLLVYYGTESSASSRTFTAISGNNNPINTQNNSFGNYYSGSSNLASHDNIYNELIKAKNQLDLNAQKLSRVLDQLGVMNPSLQSLLTINTDNLKELKDIQNKVSDLRAVSVTTRKIVEQKSTEPIVETYMKFNSVEIHFLITNPSESPKTLKFKAYLPEEAKPEYIMDLNGLNLDYDANVKTYYVYGDITLKGKESITKKIEMKDIWIFDEQVIINIKKQANDLFSTLDKTQYQAQGLILKNNIEEYILSILNTQDNSYSSPQEHIVVYRENKEKFARVESELNKLKDLVVQAGTAQNMVGKVGGIQTFATWGIILAIVFGFAIMAAIIFAMWRHQIAFISEMKDVPQSKIYNHTKTKEDHIERYGIINRRNRQINIRTIIRNIILFSLILGSSLLFYSKYTYIFNKIFKSSTTNNDDLNHIYTTNSTQKDKNVLSNNDESISTISTTTQNIENNSINLTKQLSSSSSISEAISTNMPKLKIINTPTGWLNVRKEAAIDSEILLKIYPKDEFYFKEKLNGWYMIILKNNSVGWVNEKYVEVIK